MMIYIIYHEKKKTHKHNFSNILYTHIHWGRLLIIHIYRLSFHDSFSLNIKKKTTFIETDYIDLQHNKLIKK